VAACRCFDECDTVRIIEDDIVVWRLDQRKLGAAVASALGADPEWNEVDGLPMTWRVGTYTPLARYRFPAYLTIQPEDYEFRTTIAELVARNDQAFIVTAPTSESFRAVSEELLAKRGACFLSLADFLVLDKVGRLASDQPASELLAKFHAAVLPRPDIGVRAFFPTPAGATWDDVTIGFTDGHTVSIKVRGATGRFNYTQMGLANSRNGEPTVQWHLLSAFANEGGAITWESAYADRRNKKRCEVLAQGLKV